MRRYSIGLITIIVCFVFVGATAVKAQGTRRFVIYIPFEFTIAGRLMPAGKYAIERIDPAKPNLVILKNTENGMFRLFLTQRVESEQIQAESSVIFERRKGEFHLFQLWMLGYNDGNQVPSVGEGEPRNQRNDFPTVALKVSNKKH